jgi:prepilin-type N-terminal cleavage/methylation domain-containing protein
VVEAKPSLGRFTSAVWENEKAFSLVELMVVTAIIAILSSVAIPAYVNYINRSNQSDGITVLMNAKMDQEVFFEQNFRYAGTAGCLPSLYTGADANCLSNCGNCSQTVYTTGKGYRVSVVSGSTQRFTVAATRKYYSYAPVDRLEVASTLSQPRVVNPTAIGFSLFKWIFN